MKQLLHQTNRRGAAVAEFAILLPFLVFIFVVGLDWCRIFYAANTLDDCARTGALAASGIAYLERDLSDSEREARGKEEAVKGGTSLQPALAESAVKVSSDGTYVTVTVSYDFHTLAPYPGIGSTWHLSRSARMPIHP